jgi:hypothetical protein
MSGSGKGKGVAGPPGKGVAGPPRSAANELENLELELLALTSSRLTRNAHSASAAAAAAASPPRKTKISFINEKLGKPLATIVRFSPSNAEREEKRAHANYGMRSQRNRNLTRKLSGKAPRNPRHSSEVGMPSNFALESARARAAKIEKNLKNYKSREWLLGSAFLPPEIRKVIRRRYLAQAAEKGDIKKFIDAEGEKGNHVTSMKFELGLKFSASGSATGPVHHSPAKVQITFQSGLEKEFVVPIIPKEEGKILGELRELALRIERANENEEEEARREYYEAFGAPPNGNARRTRRNRRN